MLQCPVCTSAIPPDSRFCSQCGSSLGPESTPTQTSVPEAGVASAARGARTTSDAQRIAARTDSLVASRFDPGTILAGRYRVVGLLGRGGMGEVYRADDLKLGQPVALKFLPEILERSQERLERFLNEVKIARQVSHPNVCRVYDVAEAHGRHFLSMEYVDGEDLASLLRRIGRLEREKAVEIARQICAGLAAAHGRGVIHRDLKPANVMIDGEGQVRLTDFGLAALAESVRGGEIRAGTPGYMAPEQLAGREVSVRSDLYSLGLVLYELFTGKPAFRANSLVELRELVESGTPQSPSTWISDFDPVVERVILRCLERDPARRPASAIAVAAALPGGDPLAAALAAGETPSPDIVAAAGPEGSLAPARALAWLAAFLGGLVLSGFLLETITLYGQARPEKPVAALVADARAIAARLGYADRPADDYGRYAADLARLQRPLDRAGGVTEAGDLLHFVYRRSDGAIAPRNFLGRVTESDPPLEPGDLYMRLSSRGRLRYLVAAAPAVAPAQGPAAAANWGSLFEAAGLERDRLRPTAPTLQPGVFADSRVAWVGPVDPAAPPEVRVEAAAAAGRPVFFHVVTPDDGLWSAETLAASREEPSLEAVEVFVLAMIVVVALAALLLAIHNGRRGRGDRRGAMRLGLYVLTLALVQALAARHHVADISGEFTILVSALGSALVVASLTWVLYMALEPYVRRWWPEALVAWSRLLAGRVRDPLVGRDLLIGSAFGVGFLLLQWVSQKAPEWLGLAVLPPIPWGVGPLSGGRHALAALCATLVASLAAPLGYTVLVLFLRIVLRRQWLAASAFLLLFALSGAISYVQLVREPSPALIVFGALLGLAGGAILITLLLRFGLLATAGCFVVVNVLAAFPVTLRASAPFFTTSLVALIVAAALGLWAFYLSQAGRPLLSGLLPD